MSITDELHNMSRHEQIMLQAKRRKDLRASARLRSGPGSVGYYRDYMITWITSGKRASVSRQLEVRRS